ncbi:MAG: hypothetical protein ACI87W_003446 [Halieaceae bacterium]|jgi:hypothetical protein
MLNRDLIVVRIKQPFVDWINETEPEAGKRGISLDAANEDSPAFLIHEYAGEDLDHWLEQCYTLLFEEILEQWYIDPALWPENRTLSLFKAWCELEIHSMVLDVVDEPLEDDENHPEE